MSIRDLLYSEDYEDNEWIEDNEDFLATLQKKSMEDYNLPAILQSYK